MLKEYLELGQIVGTHGVRGELRVNPWCDSPEFIKQFKKYTGITPKKYYYKYHLYEKENKNIEK